MKPTIKASVALALALILTSRALAHPTYTGYSGAPGRSTCASSCHGGSGGSLTVTGFPSSYTPGQAYTITIGHSGGSAIANFNASIRVGTGSVNGGAIAAGTATSAYNVSGETNGVHFTSTQQNSGTFSWTAPAAGTGAVTLYAAGLQGTSSSGQNGTVVLTASEATVLLPGAASGPSPANNASGVALNATLSWTAGTGATSHDVRFGTTNPPAMIGNQTGTSYNPGTLTASTVYYWRIDERNSAGVTTGTIWQFTTQTAPPPLPGAASGPSPANNASGVALNATLSWTAGTGATSHDVRFGTTNPPAMIGNQTGTSYNPGTLTASTVYYWRIDERNSAGVTTGTIWQFTTQTAPPPLPGAASGPSPANNASGVALNATLSWTAGTGATSHDVRFGTTNPPAMIGNQTGTSYNPGALTASTVYYWRIDERNSTGVTTGTIWQFTAQTSTPGGASNPSPPDGATRVSKSVTLSWSGHAGSRYDVYLGTSTPPTRVARGRSSTQFHPQHQLQSNTLYYWRVDEITSEGRIQGDVWSFRTRRGGHDDDEDEAGTEGTLPAVAALGVAYPNPFNATISVPFELTEASDIRLAIYDITGREVALLANGYYPAGIHQTQWSSHDVSTGVYLVRLEAQGQTVTTRITALK